MAQLTLQVLGGFRLQDAAGNELRVTSRKARALLAYLCLRPEGVCSRDRLAALLWEDSDDELARTSLRQALAALRKCLPDSAQAALVTDTDSIRVDIALLDSDVAAFRRCISAGTRTALQEANAIYRGDLLDGFDARSGSFDEWVSSERLTLRKHAVEALQRLTSLCSSSEDSDGALSAATRLVALEPLNEAAHRTLMELHARRNAYAEALRQYRLCRDALRRELDVAPEPATESLYRDLMRRRRAAAINTETEDPIGDDQATLAPAEMEPERRPELREAVVLVARLEGLLDLEGVLDPEESYALSAEFQNRVQRAVQEFGGCNDRRVGSSVVAVFGLPTAYGNEAERAVRAALMLRDLIAREPWPGRQQLGLRVGIAQGQILSGADVFPLTGRPSQVAHALAARADNAGILISEELRRSLGERITILPAKPAAAVTNQAWALQGIRADNGGALQPFVGRRPELAMILAVLERCTSTRHGRAIVIRGEAGIGKTRLTNAVRSAAVERGAAVHSAQIYDFGQSPGRRPITVLALSLLGVDADAPAAQRAVAARQLAEHTGAGVDQIIYLSDLVDAPLDAELQSIERAMEVTTRQRGRSLALAQLIEHAAQRTPLLISVEDVHWADSDELARLGEIAATVAHCPILFVMTTRPEGDPLNATWRARARGCPVTTVDLAPLASDEAHELAAHYAELPLEVIESCVRRAEGYPLFLDQLLRAANAGHAALPGSVRGLVLARVDRLSTEDRRALQAGSVLGHRFSLAALRFLVENEDLEPTALLDAALIRCDGPEIEFAHALFRDALYESILKSQRRDLHRRAAEWFAGKDGALHADHLAAAEDERAACAYIDAAHMEQEALRFERALALAIKANALAREPELLHQTSCLIGELLLQLGRTHDALAAYREALDYSQNPTSQGHAWFGVAATLRIMDRHEEALDALDRAESALGGTDAQTRARLCTLRGNLCFPLGRFDACLRAHEQAQHFATLAKSSIDIARALGGLGDAYYQRGRMLTAQRLFAQCIEEARKQNLTGVLLANIPMLGVTQNFCGAPLLSGDSFREALELARRAGDMRSELLVQLGMASMYLMQAQADEAICSIQRSMDLASQLGARRFQAEGLGILAAALLARGDRAEALIRAEEAVELGRETGMSYCGPVLLSVVARATTDSKQRQQALDEGAALLAGGCVSHSYFEFYTNAMEVSLQEHLWQDARHYADELAAYTSEEPLPWSDILIQRARALADIGEGLSNNITRAQLTALRSECVRMNTLVALPQIEAALRS